MNKDPKIKWGGLLGHRLTGRFILDTALTLLVLSLLFTSTQMFVRVLAAASLILTIFGSRLMLHMRLFRPAKSLADGITGSPEMLPVNDDSAIGAAARAHNELRIKAEALDTELNSLRGGIQALEAREAEQESKSAAARDELARMSSEAERLNNRIAAYEGFAERAGIMLKRVSALDFSEPIAETAPLDYEGAALKGLSEDINRVYSITEQLYDQAARTLNAVANGNYTSMFTNPAFGELDEKMQAIRLRIEQVESSAAAAKLEAAKQEDKLGGIAARLMDASAGGGLAAQALVNDIGNMTAEISRGADLLEKVSSIAGTVKTQFREGQEALASTREALSEINASSSNILNIIKSIDDIAFQTQLLSLNASIEAARAGHHGRSFAVVASKVGDLAGESKESADETGTLLESMIEQFRESAAMSEKTVRIMEQFIGSLDEIIKAANETGQGIARQAAIAEGIKGGLEKISGNVHLSGSIIAEFTGGAYDTPEVSSESPKPRVKTVTQTNAAAPKPESVKPVKAPLYKAVRDEGGSAPEPEQDTAEDAPESAEVSASEPVPGGVDISPVDTETHKQGIAPKTAPAVKTVNSASSVIKPAVKPAVPFAGKSTAGMTSTYKPAAGTASALKPIVKPATGSVTAAKPAPAASVAAKAPTTAAFKPQTPPAPAASITVKASTTAAFKPQTPPAPAASVAATASTTAAFKPQTPPAPEASVTAKAQVTAAFKPQTKETPKRTITTPPKTSGTSKLPGFDGSTEYNRKDFGKY